MLSNIKRIFTILYMDLGHYYSQMTSYSGSILCSVSVCDQSIMFAVLYTQFSNLFSQIIVYISIELTKRMAHTKLHMFIGIIYRRD